MMKFMTANGVNLHYSDDGAPDAVAIVFSNSLGTDFRLWDRVVQLLPGNLRVVRYDKRGHGLSSCPAGPYSMVDLADDCAALLDTLGVRQCFFVGLSIGGLTAQQLALTRPDLIRAVVLSNTGARIGDRQLWESRIKATRAGRLDEMTDVVIERWFSTGFRRRCPEETEGWRTMLTRTTSEGYASCCEAILSADFSRSISSIGVPAYLIAGSEDGATPVDLVQWTASLIPHSKFRVIDGAGHLACVDSPEEYVGCLKEFMRDAGVEIAD